MRPTRRPLAFLCRSMSYPQHTTHPHTTQNIENLKSSKSIDQQQLLNLTSRGLCTKHVKTYSPTNYRNMLQIKVFQKRLKTGRNRHPRARRNPGAATPRTGRRRPPHHKPGACHHTRSQHYYAHRCRGRIDPTPNHLRTAQNGQQGIQQ